MALSTEAFNLADRAERLKPSSTLAVTARVNELKQAGVDVIGFGAGQPDSDTPDNIKQAAIASLLAGRTKYVATPGAPEARSAIAAKLRTDNNIDCSPEHIVITVGAKHALYMTMQTILEPGDEVVLPTPCWVSYRPMAELAGARVIEVPGSIEHDFKITPEQLASAITPRTRAVLINSPSNPCGTMYTPDELRALGSVVARHERMFIVTDEIYEKLIYGDCEHFSLGAFEPTAARTITINGLSKAFAMTGWRIGYLCAPGHDGAIARAVPRLQDQMTGNITSFCYAAIVEALTNSADSVAALRETLAERATIMWDRVSAIPGFRCPKPTGAFYVFPDISACLGGRSPGGAELTTPLDFAAALLDETGVAVVPGEDFGEAARTHIRLSFACSTEDIVRGTDRLRTWVERLG